MLCVTKKSTDFFSARGGSVYDRELTPFVPLQGETFPSPAIGGIRTKCRVNPSLNKRGGKGVSFQDVTLPKLKRHFPLSKTMTTKLEKNQI
jgi:hypothetical protein